jgi:hypothetical protein
VVLAVVCAPDTSGKLHAAFESASARPSAPTGVKLEITDLDAIRRVAAAAMRARCRQRLSAGRGQGRGDAGAIERFIVVHSRPLPL